MQLSNVFRMVSILAYCLIILNGEMISLPFICFLYIALFVDIGSLTQVCAILAFIGLISSVILIVLPKTKRILLFETIVFILLLLPLLDRLTSVPILLFNYAA